MNWQNLTEKQKCKFVDDFHKGLPIPAQTCVSAFNRHNPEIKGSVKNGGFFVAHKDFKIIISELIS